MTGTVFERNATAHGGHPGSLRISSPVRATRSPNGWLCTVYGTQRQPRDDRRSAAGSLEDYA